MFAFNRSLVKKEIRANLKLSIPLIASQLLYSLTGFIGTALVARLGQNALAASILVSLTWWSLCIIFLGTLNAVSVLVAHQFGAKESLEVSKVMGQSMILAWILVGIITIILFFTPIVFKLIDQPSVVLRLAHDYMVSIHWVVPLIVFMILFEQYLIGLGRTRFVLMVSGFNVPLTVMFMYFLVFGYGVFPRCGIAGLGYGMACADAITVLMLLLYILKSKTFKEYEIFRRVRWQDAKYLRELIRVGLPIGLMGFVEVGGLTAMTYAIAFFGTVELAANQIAFQFLSFFIVIVFAMSQAVSVRVGHGVGEFNRTQVNYAIGVGIGLNSFIMFIFALIIALFPHTLMRLDMNTQDVANQALVAKATVLMRIIALWLVIENLRLLTANGALRGIKDTRFPSAVAFISFWIIGMPLAYVCGFMLNGGAVGIWIGMTFGIIAGTFIIVKRLQRKLKELDLRRVLAVRE